MKQQSNFQNNLYPSSKITRYQKYLVRELRNELTDYNIYIEKEFLYYSKTGDISPIRVDIFIEDMTQLIQLVIECDGEHHKYDNTTKRSDSMRTDFIKNTVKIDLLRVTNSEINNSKSCKAFIDKVIHKLSVQKNKILSDTINRTKKHNNLIVVKEMKQQPSSNFISSFKEIFEESQFLDSKKQIEQIHEKKFLKEGEEVKIHQLVSK